MANEELGGERRYRSAFDLFLRTGRRFDHRAGADVEVKFNPWHDPDDGRFTFANNGNYFAPGSRQIGGGGSFGGGGATSKERWPADTAKQPSSKPARKPTTVRQGANVSGRIEAGQSRKPSGAGGEPGEAGRIGNEGTPASNHRHVVRNGYEYEIDDANHPFGVAGTLRTGSGQGRDRRAQAEAGGKDRLATDEGGHLIARRFDGPKDAFNHFPQDRNFNRSGYAKLENELARLQREGKVVRVSVSVIYKSTSWRPVFIDFKYTVDGIPKGQRFPNAPEIKK